MENQIVEEISNVLVFLNENELDAVTAENIFDDIVEKIHTKEAEETKNFTYNIPTTTITQAALLW